MPRVWGEIIKSAEVVNASLDFLEKRKRLVFREGLWGEMREKKTHTNKPYTYQISNHPPLSHKTPYSQIQYPPSSSPKPPTGHNLFR